MTAQNNKRVYVVPVTRAIGMRIASGDGGMTNGVCIPTGQVPFGKVCQATGISPNDNVPTCGPGGNAGNVCYAGSSQYLHP